MIQFETHRFWEWPRARRTHRLAVVSGVLLPLNALQCMAYVSTAESRCGTGMELFTVYFFVGSALAIIDLSHLIVTPWTREMAVRRLILTVFVGTWVAIHYATYR